MKATKRVEVSEIKIVLTIERTYLTEGGEKEFLSNLRVKEATVGGKRVKGEDFGGLEKDIRFPVDEGEEMGIDVIEWAL